MGGVFVSYRRDDSAPWAGRIADSLVQRFGSDRIFIDVEAIGPGENYRRAIVRTLSEADAVIVVIGPGWMSTTAADGTPRIRKTGDLHRAEIATALGAGVRVIPVLVGGATVPDAAELPDDIAELTNFNAVHLDDRKFGRDMQVVGDAVAPLLTDPETSDAPRRTDSGRRRKLVAVGSTAILALGVVALVVISQGGSEAGDDVGAVPTGDAEDDAGDSDVEPPATEPADSGPVRAVSATTTTSTTTSSTSTSTSTSSTSTSTTSTTAASPVSPGGGTPETQPPVAATTTRPTTTTRPAPTTTRAPTTTEPPSLEAQRGLPELGTEFRLKTQFMGDDYCLESNDPDWDPFEGASYMAPCDFVTGQYWRFERVGDDWYKLKSSFQGDGRCLESNDPESDSRSGAAYMENCVPATGQNWQFDALGGGWFHLKTQFLGSNTCLEGNDPQFGAAFMAPCVGATGQIWQLVPA